MIKVINVAGARPNFMKVAPIVAAMKRRANEFESILVHTGQHYDAAMSDAFFRDLEMPEPDVDLGVGSASHAVQTAGVIQSFEPYVIHEKPDWVIVVGDVNSTVACALVCAKLGVKVAHVEAGLRSRDRTMPEEINRLLTDQMSELLLTPSLDANANLLAEGIPEDRIRFVGNIMIDSLFAHLERAKQSQVLAGLGLKQHEYAVLTLHRPSNVDEKSCFRAHPRRAGTNWAARAHYFSCAPAYATDDRRTGIGRANREDQEPGWSSSRQGIWIFFVWSATQSWF